MGVASPAHEREVGALPGFALGVRRDIEQSVSDALEADVGFLVPSANAGGGVLQAVDRRVLARAFDVNAMEVSAGQRRTSKNLGLPAFTPKL